MSEGMQTLETRFASPPGLPAVQGAERPGLGTETDRDRWVAPKAPSLPEPKASTEAELPRGSNTTTARASMMTPDWQVEEYFRGIVEEVGDEAVRVAVTSSEGEEGTGWIPWAEIEPSEREYALVGAPIRISILKPASGTQTRQKRVRFLRPSQYQPPKRTRDGVASYLLERMQAVLSEHG